MMNIPTPRVCILFIATILICVSMSVSANSPPASSDASLGSPMVNKHLLVNATIVDIQSKKTRTRTQRAIYVENGKIIAVFKDNLKRRKKYMAEGVQVHDLQQAFVLPGLVDAHVHVWDKAELNAYLAYGVTTVRNASGMPFLLGYAQAIQEGVLIGPRLLTTGPIINSPGPNQQPNHQLVESAQQARQAVRQQFKLGYRHLKVYSNLQREAYEAVREEAAVLGMTIMGHTPEGERKRNEQGKPLFSPDMFDIRFDEILDDGFVTIEHMESIVWHALAENLDRDAIPALAKKLAKSGVAVTPTLIAHDNLLRVAQTDGEYLKRAGTEMLNPFISMMEAELYQAWAAQPKDIRAEFPAFYAYATKTFHEQGVLMLAGSDAGIFTNIPGQALHEELQLLVAAGLTPEQALRTATINAATVLNLPDIGQILPGKVADLVVVSQNPLQDIGVLEHPHALMAAGRWYDQAGLDGLKQQAAKVNAQRTQDQVLQAITQQAL